MDTVSLPVVSPQAFLAAKAQARAELQQDLTMDRAADLAAQRNILLQEDAIPPALKATQLKHLNRKVRHWTKKARQPFGTGNTPEADNEMDAAPTQAMMSGLVNAIKQATTPGPPNSQVTPPPKKKRKPRVVATPLSKTPSTRKAKKKKPKTPLTGVKPLDAWETDEEGPSTSSADKLIEESRKRREYYKKRREELAKKKKEPQTLKQSLKEGAKEGAKKTILKGVESFFNQKGSGAVLPWIEF